MTEYLSWKDMTTRNSPGLSKPFGIITAEELPWNVNLSKEKAFLKCVMF